MDNLKPCPLCGGNDLQVDEMKDMFENDDSVWWRVICLYCRGEAPGETEAEAITAWNNRPEPRVLSLEEMNQLCGEPTYFLHVDGDGSWFLNGWHLPVASTAQNHGRATLYLGNRINVDLDNYGKTWLAYTAKPTK